MEPLTNEEPQQETTPRRRNWLIRGIDRLDSGVKRVAAFIGAVTTIIGAVAAVIAIGNDTNASFCDTLGDIRSSIHTTASSATAQPEAMNQVMILAERASSEAPAEIREQAFEFSRTSRLLNELYARTGYRMESATQDDVARIQELSVQANTALRDMEIYYRDNC